MQGVTVNIYSHDRNLSINFVNDGEYASYQNDLWLAVKKLKKSINKAGPVATQVQFQIYSGIIHISFRSFLFVSCFKGIHRSFTKSKIKNYVNLPR